MKTLEQITNEAIRRIYNVDGGVKRRIGLAIEWERNRDKWISVDDEMPVRKTFPELDQDVLHECTIDVNVWSDEDGHNVGHFNHYLDWWFDKKYTKIKVTHWQPLPQTPKR